MSEIIGSLFGVTADQYQRNRDLEKDRLAFQLAQADPDTFTNFLAQSGGRGLGNIIGRALGGVDPELQRISRRQQIMGMIDPSQPETFEMAAQAALEGGDQQLAFGLRTERANYERKVLESNALIAQRTRENEPKPFVIGNSLVSPEGTVLYSGPDAAKYSGIAKELIDAGFEPGSEEFKARMREYIDNKSKGAAKGTGNVTIGSIGVDTGEASKAAGKVVGANVANIDTQYSLLTAFNDAVSLLDNGIYGGAYGPEQAAATKYSLGLLGNKDKLVNTEVFLANIGEIVIPRLQAFGGNDSNEELKYLQRVVAGDQRLEPAAMKRILGSAEKKTRNNLARLKKQAEGELPTGPINEPPTTPVPTKRYVGGKIVNINGN